MENLLNLAPTSVVALFETNKVQRQSFVTMLIDSLDNGNVDPLKIHLQVKCMEDIIKQLNESPTYKEAVLSKAQTYASKEFDFINSKISIREVGTKYDFSNCEDPIYSQLETQSKELSEKLKQRAEFLKKAPSEGTVIVDEQTGETTKVFPPSKTSTTSVVVSLK